jgi:predicted Zn-dependent peptidase
VKHSLFAAAFAVGAFAAAFGPAQAASALPAAASAGGTVIVQQSDPQAGLLGVEFLVRAGLDRETLKENGLAALVAESVLQTPVAVQSGAPATTPLQQAVANSGGSVRFAVDPGDVRFYVQVLPSAAPGVLALVGRALAAPDFSDATVRSARAILVRKIAASQQFALHVGIDMLNAASSPQANAGMPALGTPASLAQFVPADAQRFYRTYYRRGGSLISAAGRIDALPAGALAALGATLPAGETMPVKVKVTMLKGASHEIVTHRDVASPWLIAQYPAPGVDSKDFGPMLVLAAFVKRTLADIAQVPGVVSETFASRSVGTVYNYDRSPADLVLYVNGGIGDPSRAFATALSVVNILAATRLEGSIGDFKAAAAGDFASEATTLETRAWLGAVFASSSPSPDYLHRALQAISHTTAADVQRVARRYLGKPTIALVLPRSGG